MENTQKYILSSVLEGSWNIICDFDGTITPYDVTDAVLQRFALPAWEAVEQDWLDGKITARTCMEKQVGMINATKEELDNFLDSIPLTDGFREFINFCGEKRLDAMVVSDGMDYAIRRVLSRHGVDSLPVIANKLCFHDSAYSLEFPHGTPECTSGVCKCSVAARDGKRILLIGDSHSDICLAGIAAFVLAKRDKPLHRYCREKNIAHIPYDTFFDIITIINAMDGGYVESEDITRPFQACNTVPIP